MFYIFHCLLDRIYGSKQICDREVIVPQYLLLTELQLLGIDYV